MQEGHAVQGDQDGRPPVGLSAPNVPYAEGGVRSMGEGGMIAPERSSDWDSEEESPQREGIDQFVDIQVNRRRMSRGWVISLGGTGGRAREEGGRVSSVYFWWYLQAFSVGEHSCITLSPQLTVVSGSALCCGVFG